MITDIEIRNIQAHRETVMSFSPGLNVIKGTSHNGKSSIIRALRWALFNRPLGKGLKSHFAKDGEAMEVTIAFSDGSYVMRQSDKKFNGYAVCNDQDEESDYEALRGDIPQEVLDILQMDSRNFHGQDDGYFLISNSAGDVARELNKAAGLSEIDRIFKNVSKKGREISDQVKVWSHAEETASKDLLSFKDLDKIEPIIISLEKADEELAECRALKSKLVQASFSLMKLREETEALKEKVAAEGSLLAIAQKVSDLGAVVKEKENLENLGKSLSEVKQQIKEDTDWLSCEKPHNELFTKISEMRRIAGERVNILTVCNDIKRLRTMQNSSNERLVQLQSSYNDKQKLLEKCPKCGALKIYWEKENA